MSKTIIFYDKPGKKLSETTGLADILHERFGKDIRAICLQDLSILLDGTDCSVTYEGNDVFEGCSGIYIRTLSAARDIAAVVAASAKQKGIRVYDTEADPGISFSKLQQMYMIGKSGLPIPKTYFGHLEKMAKDVLGYPMVVKATVASKGRDNYLVQSVEELTSKLAGSDRSLHFIAQQFIPNHFDYRLLVFGDQVRVAIKRSRASSETHLNNTSQGADAQLVAVDDVDENVILDAVAAAQLLGRQVAGVDVLAGDDGSHYLLEVNRTPQIATGSFVDEKLKALHEFLED